MKLFVYGTLKRGYSNNHLLEGANFLCRGYTAGHLYGGGAPKFKDGNGLVYGEIFEITEEHLPALDSLEGHPVWWKREVRKVYLYGVEEDHETDAYIYVWQRPVYGDPIEGGKWDVS